MLEFDAWDLAGTEWCDAGIWHKNVFFSGRGGCGVYTYYWNGVQVADPTTESYTFEVHSAGGAMAYDAEVFSGDGQHVKKGLLIPEPACH